VRRVLSSKLTALIVAMLGVPGLVVLHVLWSSWDLEDLRGVIEAEISFRLHRAVRIGGISGNPWSGLVLSDVAVAERGADFRTPFVTARIVKIHYRGRDILHGAITPQRGISLIEVEGLYANLDRHADDTWNFQDLLPKPGPPQADRFAGRVVIRNGRAHYRDAVIRTGRGTVDVTPDDIDLEADFSRKSWVTVSGSLSGGTEPVGRLTFSGEIGQDAIDHQRFTIEGAAIDLPYVVSHLFVSPNDLQAEAGTVHAVATVAIAPKAPPAYAVKAEISGGRFRFPSSVRGTVDYDGDLTAAGANLFTEGARVRYGNSTAVVRGSLLGLEGGTPAYDADLTEASLDTAELLSEWPLLPEGYTLSLSGPVKGTAHVSGSAREAYVTADLVAGQVDAQLPGGAQATVEGLTLVGDLSDSGIVSTQGSVAETPVQVATGPLFDAPDWLKVANTALVVSGKVQASVALAGKEPTARLTLREGTGRFLDTDLTGLTADIELSREEVHVPAFSGSADGARFDGKGIVRFADGRPSYDFSGSVGSFDLAQVTRIVDLGKEPVSGRIAGKYHVASGPGDDAVSGTFKGRIDDLVRGNLGLERVVVAARTDGREVSLPWVEITDDIGAATGAARLVPGKKEGDPLRIVDGRVAARGVDLSAVERVLQPADAKWPEIGGTGDFVGTFGGTPASPWAQGKVFVSAPKYDKWSCDSAVAEVSVDRDEIVIGDLQARRKYATVTVNGTVADFLAHEDGSPAQPRLDLLVRADRVSVADAYEMLEQPNTYEASGLAYGELSVHGTPDSLHGGGSLKVRDGSVGDWPIREARADFSLEGTDLNVKEARVAIDPGAVTARGVVHDVLSTRYLDLSWAADDLKVDPEAQSWARRYRLAGTVGTSGTILGPFDSFDASLTIRASDMSAGGERFTSARIEARARRFPDTGVVLVDFGPARLEGAGGMLTSAGFWDSGSGAANVSFDAAGLRFTSLAALLATWSEDPAAVAPVTEAAATVGGDVYGHIELDGRPGDLTVTVTGGRLENAAYRGEPLPSLTGTVTWDQGDETIEVPEFAAIEPEGSITGSLEAELGGEGRLTANVDGDGVSVARLARLFNLQQRVDEGTLAFHVVAHGKTHAPAIEGNMVASELQLPLGKSEEGRPPQVLRLERVTAEGVRVREGAVEADRVALGDPDTGLSVTDVLVPFSWQERGLVRDAPMHATIDLPRQQIADISLLPELTRKWGIAGLVESDLQITGTLDRPEVRGMLAVHDGRASWTPTDDLAKRVLGAQPVQLSGVDAALAVSPGQDNELARVSVEKLGGAVLGGAFAVSGSASFADASLLSKRNRLDLRAEASGLTHRVLPGPYGVAKLNNAALTITHDPVTGLNTLGVEDLNLALGTGTITGTGTLAIDPALPASELGYNKWDLAARLDSVPVNARDLLEFAVNTVAARDENLSYLNVGKGYLDGTVNVTSPAGPGPRRGPRPARVSGEIVLRDAELTIPTALPSGGAAAAWELARDDFEFDLGLRVGDNAAIPMLGCMLQGGATLTGTLRQPALAGRFASAAGSISVLGRKWDLEQLGLDFSYQVRPVTRTLELQARLDVRAAAWAMQHGRDIRVILSIEGPLGETSIHLTSEPPLPEQELMGLLTSAGTEGGAGGTGGLTSLSQALSTDLTQALSGLAGEQAVSTLLGRIQQALGLQRFKLETTEGAKITGFDVEGEIAKNLFLRFRESANQRYYGRPELRLGLKYDLPAQAHLALETDDTGDVRASVELKFTF